MYLLSLFIVLTQTHVVLLRSTHCCKMLKTVFIALSLDKCALNDSYDGKVKSKGQVKKFNIEEEELQDICNHRRGPILKKYKAPTLCIYIFPLICGSNSLRKHVSH